VSLLDLDGLALALACSAVAVLVALLAELGALADTARGLVRAACVVGGIAVAAFAPPAIFLGGIAAAAIGLVLYFGLFVLLRPRPLRRSWQYLRALS
jgi:Kef-type K+ transport system membrane component KefB